VRIVRDGDLPLHFEAAPLKPAVVAVGWPVAILACAAGVLLYARAGSTVVEAAASLLALVGVSLVGGLARCRRYEITLGKRMIELRAGPFRRILPVGTVDAAKAGSATSWRRVFADRELELTLSVSAQKTIVPSNNPDELRAALRMANPGTETETGTETGPQPRSAGEKSEIRNPKPEIQGRMGGNS
jgi:hypothetical protein